MPPISYTSNHFKVEFDQGRGGAYLRAVEGGFAKATLVSEPVGSDTLRVHHTATREIDPVTMEVGMSECKDIIRWLSDSMDKSHSRRSGAIVHADFNLEQRFMHQFRDALIMEAAFPALDAASKDSAYLKVKFMPEWVETRRQRGPRIDQVPSSPIQKSWNVSAFRLNIDGIDLSRGVNKIDAFTIKQGVKPLHIGGELYPELVATKLEIPELSVTVSVEHAESLIKWHERFVRAGAKDKEEEKSGSIEFLSPNRGQTMFDISLENVGIKGLSLIRSDAGGDAIKRVKVDLYVGNMKFGSLGSMA
jgi:hypothetical protein